MRYTGLMRWGVEYTDQFSDWFVGIDSSAQESIVAAVEMLEEYGPALGRPLVDTLTGTSLSNLKELRPQSGNIRVLFVFDPRRTAILLIGGDKTGRWSAWYAVTIPIAERLYAEHLALLKKEGLL
jgi:hypothetical protein